jgi:hypothetical protein
MEVLRSEGGWREGEGDDYGKGGEEKDGDESDGN